MNEKSLIGKCPYTTAQKVLTGKWPLLIMHIEKGNGLHQLYES